LPTLSRFAAGRWARAAGAVVLALASSSCGPLFGPAPPPVGQPGHVSGFLGAVVADEPRATLIGREVLSEGGDAADAAVAVGFALAVTLPSRAGLGGSGACLAYAPGRDTINGGVPEAILFTPRAPAETLASADRPAALPMLARGLYLLHARYGTGEFARLVVPAEELARLGTGASRAFVRDLNLVAGPLFADPQARQVFGVNGTPLSVGQSFQQPALATTLAAIRTAGVGDFYQGTLAQRIAEASPTAGGPLSLDDLRRALPSLAPAITIPYRHDQVSFLPPPADGGLGAAAAFSQLTQNPEAISDAAGRATSVVARWRSVGGYPEALLSTPLPPASLLPLPASTTFLTLDNKGNAVACALSMDNLFGTGRIVPGLGFLLAASPAMKPPPLLAAAIAWNRPIHAFRAETAGSGQEAASLAAALAMMNTLRTDQPMPVPVPDPGRANVIACSRYLPGASGLCGWAADPRGDGIAVGGG
jgi:gamma-glutamyltranspeptidase / glutathione hydrolase